MCGLKTDSGLTCWGSDRSGEAYPPGGQFNSVVTVIVNGDTGRTLAMVEHRHRSYPLVRVAG